MRRTLERKSLGDISFFILRLSWLITLLLLSGCMLVSGERTAQDAQAAGGNVTTTFVSAEGSAERTFAIGGPPREVQVIGIVSVDSGDLTVEVLAPDGSVAFAIGSRPGEAVTRSGDVALDEEGRLRYRIRATGARNGSFQLLYQELSGVHRRDAEAQRVAWGGRYGYVPVQRIMPSPIQIIYASASLR